MQDSDHEHVPLAEIAELYEAAVREEETLDDIVASHPHLAECALCRERLLKCADLDRRLKVLPIASEDVQKSDCPDPLLWADIATGVMDNEPALRYIQHASGCDLCGRRLKQAVIDLSAEVTPREKSLLDSLPSARKEWARSLAKRIAGSRTSGSWAAARWLTLPRLALAGVGLAGLALAGLWFTSNRNHVRSVSQLLAKAYSDQRTFELRIPGARYATPRVQLGEESSFANRSPALLKAETIIADQLPSQPDASWLQVKAQADLLEGRYDPAVQSLRRALQQSPNSAGIMIDLATAYFQRGLVNHSPEDYSIAYEQLSRALEVQPDSPVALFNRAIVAERQYLYQQALDDWDRYLRLDPDSDWAKEARQRADSVRAKIKAKQTQGSLLSPSDIAGRLKDAALPGVIEPRLDQYLDLATYGWLPEAYPERTPASPSARVALFFFGGADEIAGRSVALRSS